ncbi:MAG: type VI secretion system tip protein TssI/VgrG [Propionivibrio sp.]
MQTSLADLAAAGVALFTQNSRLLKLRFAESRGIDEEALLPHRLVGEEGLSVSYRYVLDCLSADTHLELKALLGQPAEISLLLPDGGSRLLSGLVTHAAQAGADGGFAQYVFTLEPALALLTHRRNSRVFQDKSVPQIVCALLDEHLAANPAFPGVFQYHSLLSQDYPVRSYCLQYRESDLAFIERLLAEEGISYRYSHGPDPATSLQNAHENHDADALPQHTLVLFDRNDDLPACRPDDEGGSGEGAASRTSRPSHRSRARTGTPILRFHRSDGVETDDAIDTWTAERQIQSGRSTLASYDYQTVSTHVGADDTRINHGENGTPLCDGLEDYDAQTGYYGSDPDEMARYTELRQQAKDLAGKTFHGEGTVRHLLPGTWFELAEHSIHDQDGPEDRQFIVTRLSFTAENNLLADLSPEAKRTLGGALNGVLARGMTNPITAATPSTQSTPPYRNTFTAVRRHIPLVPEYQATTHQKPTAKGLTTATVVGPEGEEIFTDAHGRIRIQFHWQRKQDHPAGGADRDDHSSTWVRVAYPSAGAAWGTQFIPRIGQEVVVDFVEGDIDRPLVTGVVYNGTHRPPAFSGAGSLPANKTLSGHKSKEYKGSRYNELLFDDSTNEIRTKLSSEHGKTQLSQGFLIHPRSEGKGEPRGEGFELRTDESGALRAAKGLLISTWQRLNASDKQLARDEALGLMQQSLELFKQFGEYAAQHEALPVDAEPQAQLKQQFVDWEQGSNTQKDGANGGSPVIGLSASAGIHTSTPESLVSYAGRNIDTIAEQHLQQTAGQRFNLNTGQGISLFAHDEGLKAIAHHGPLLMQAHHDDAVLNAEQNITFTASQGKIIGMAEQEIVFMTAGGAYLKLAGPNVEIGCPGRYTERAASHHLLGPASMAADLPTFSSGPVDQKFILQNDPHGELTQPIAHTPYAIDLTDGSTLKGVSDAQGRTELLARDAMRIADLRFFRKKK